jgi:hypothetical protein
MKPSPQHIFGINWRHALLLVMVFGSLAIMLSMQPIKQNPDYHDFADHGARLGIPNFFDVISNIPFLLVGIAGLRFCRSSLLMSYRPAWITFFAGVAIISAGSAWYHLNPNNDTLVWDRLPMTAAFMSLLAATITERIDLRAGLRLLGPLVLAGASSVGYWRWRGNLWPYAAAQYYSILLVGMILGLFPPRYSRSADLFWVAVLYALAKMAEALDARILAVSRLISGHTLKHLIAALAVFWVLRMLVKRASLNRPSATRAFDPFHAPS